MKDTLVDLGHWEIFFYFVGWIFGVFYSIYRVYYISYHSVGFKTSYEDFSSGWAWIGGKRDTADLEWATWIPFLYGLLPWIVIQIIVGHAVKYTRSSTILCCWYLMISMAFLRHYIGILGMLSMLIQPCIACLLVSIRSKSISCIMHLLSLGLIQVTKTLHIVTQDWLGLEDGRYLMFIVAICWMQLRSISCNIDRIDSYKHRNLVGFFKDFIHSAAYCLYLPTLFLGPLILYSEFIEGVNKGPAKWTCKLPISLLLTIIRYLFWLRFTEWALHFLYFNALQYHPEIVAELEPWAFYGFGYCMGQYFLNKYVVVYGLCGGLSRVDGIEAPRNPKCIGRIHLYSDMWKHFDRGLYNFLIRYIYGPIVNTKIPLAKIFASSLSFGFVFLWHGMHMFIFIWSFLNFFGLTLETTARYVGNSSQYKRFQERYLSPRNNRRFNCALATPLLAFSAISNFYFFGGIEIGHIFMYRLFHDSFVTRMILLVLLYCCCQVSTELKNYEKRQPMKSKVEVESNSDY